LDPAFSLPIGRCTGEIRNYRAAPAKLLQSNPFKAGHPVKGGASIAEGRTYFGDDGGMVHCVNLADGKELWQFPIDGAIEATPLILDGRIYVGASNGKLYALDAGSGTKQWEFETGDKILASASWAKDPVSGAKWVLVGSYDFSFYALDTANGKLQWKVETENFINSTPAVTPEGFALFGGCDSLLHVVSLKDRKEVRAIDAEAYIPGSAAADGRTVYLGNDAKKVFAFDIDGGKTLWTFRDRNFSYFSSPALSLDATSVCIASIGPAASGSGISRPKVTSIVRRSCVPMAASLWAASMDGFIASNSRMAKNDGTTKLGRRSVGARLLPEASSS
jgi:outer membrane protein assembly factor BamB